MQWSFHASSTFLVKKILAEQIFFNQQKCDKRLWYSNTNRTASRFFKFCLRPAKLVSWSDERNRWQKQTRGFGDFFWWLRKLNFGKIIHKCLYLSEKIGWEIRCLQVATPYFWTGKVAKGVLSKWFRHTINEGDWHKFLGIPTSFQMAVL